MKVMNLRTAELFSAGRRCFSIGLLCMCFAHASATDEAWLRGEELRQRVFPKYMRADAQELQKLTADQRMMLIDHLKRRIRRLVASGLNEINLDGSFEAVELATLDDDEGRMRVVREYLRDPDNSTRTLEIVNNPKMIAMIGEELFKEQPLFWSQGDVGGLARQELARCNILYLIEGSGKFDETVRAWAHRMGREQMTDPTGTKLMRDWYRQNEAPLKAADFGKVRPGADIAREAVRAKTVEPER